LARLKISFSLYDKGSNINGNEEFFSMFSGIVEELGCILAIEWHQRGAKFLIQSPIVLQDIKVGHSLSVNGCCLTVTKHESETWTCDVVQETLDRTNLRYLKIGDRVNLERSVRYQDRLGGHLVQGHIDEMGQILNKRSFSDGSWAITIAASPTILRYSVYKGSIAVDGVSLTIADLQENAFSFALIPHTAQTTTLGYRQTREFVNIEVDLIGKYVERLVSPFLSVSSIGKVCHDQLC
jgi:riboflavin synthase